MEQVINDIQYIFDNVKCTKCYKFVKKNELIIKYTEQRKNRACEHSNSLFVQLTHYLLQNDINYTVSNDFDIVIDKIEA